MIINHDNRRIWRLKLSDKPIFISPVVPVTFGTRG